jgi:hypothetical protein
MPGHYACPPPPHLKGKALNIAAHLPTTNFSATNGWLDRFKGRHNTAYRNLSGESKSVDSETAEDWKYYKTIKKY